MIVENNELFDTPADDTIMWRYMDLQSLLYLVQNNALVFTQASAMEDKHEGHFQENHENSLKTLLHEMNRNTQGKYKPLLNADFSDIVKKSNALSYISCWMESSHDLVHMWKIYSKMNGIAIKTKYSKLKKALENEQKEDIHPGIIDYYDITLKGEPVIKDPIFRKRKEYRPENEIRLLVRPYFNCREKQFDINNIPLAVDCSIDMDFIEEVWLSPYAPKWHLSVIQKLLNKYGLKRLKVEQSDL